MNLDKLQQNWDRLGANDPWWAVLSHEDKRGNAWDIAEFFATGRTLIDEALAWSDENDVEVRREQALDFGCGAGRLTQALARHFEHVTGVDIAPSMIAVAKDASRDVPNCEFVCNDQPNLSVFADKSFDFVCSFIVLQHMEPRYAESYLKEFVSCRPHPGRARASHRRTVFSPQPSKSPCLQIQMMALQTGCKSSLSKRL